MNDDLSSKLNRLKQRHERVAQRIDQFDRQALMTPGEQDERKRLQKLKLSIRDQIATLRHRLATSDETAEHNR